MKKYDAKLVERITTLRDGLEPQVLATLWGIDPSLREEAAKFRRILSKKVYKGDLPYVARMEKAKAKLLKVRK